jgi:hypothetical protein
MQTIRETARQIPVALEADVAVAGGGPAGIAAAIAAARAGARVVLVERYGFLGGLATGGLVLYMDGLTDGDGRRVVGGIPWEVLENLRQRGGLAEPKPLSLHADSELLKVVAEDKCRAASVRLRLHSWAVGAVVEEGVVKGIITESKSGRQAVLCRVCVDATGDGDIAAFAGAEHAEGRRKIGLNVKVGGVDGERFRRFRRDRPEERSKLLAELHASGGLPLHPNPTPAGDAGVCWVNILGLAGRDDPGAAEGDLQTNFAGRLSALDVEDLTYAEVELRRRILLSLDFYSRRVPGFEDVSLLAFASQLGVRESRRIAGLHTLAREDIVSGRTYPDAVGRAGIGHPATPGSYQVSFGALVPRKVAGLLVAGRCISADHWAQQFVRLIMPAMVTGQAAGKAAGDMVQTGATAADLDGVRLSQDLAADGVLL